MRAHTHSSRPRGLLAIAAALGAIAAGAACSSDFVKQSQVEQLRVLGVQADPAELILDGGTLPKTTFTALAVEPSGAPITTQFAVCLIDTASGLPPANLDCPGDAGYTLPDAGAYGATLDLADPKLQAAALPFFVSDGGPSNVDGGLQAALAQGVPLVVGFLALAPPGGNPDGGPPATTGYATQRLQGIATITLRTQDDKNPLNHNPALHAISLDGVAIAADGSTTVKVNHVAKLEPVPESDAKEETPDAGLEKLTYSFFATAGDLDALRTTDTTATGQAADTSNQWTAPATPQTVQLWIVVRDGRNGTGWITRSVTVVP